MPSRKDADNALVDSRVTAVAHAVPSRKHTPDNDTNNH